MKRFVAISLLVCLLFSLSSKEAYASSAWVVIDGDTGRILDGNNEHVQLPIASLTKIWTALTVLESKSELGSTTITSAASSAEGSSIYLQQGMNVDVKDLLYGLMLRSGNDAAYALAEEIGGSVEGFVQLMNTQALYYELKNTVFTNPSGLHDDAHLSTAYDTALMLLFAMRNETFREIASSTSHNFEGDQVVRWQNKHRLIGSLPIAKAGKTGFTKAAGRTLATYFEEDGKKIIVVTLNEGNDWNVHEDLATKAFKQYKLVTIAKKGTYRLLPKVTAELDEPIKILLKKGEKSNVSSVVQIPQQPLGKGTGQWTISYKGEPLLTKEVSVHYKKK